jgi:cytochrome b involved in lipid metabolism
MKGKKMDDDYGDFWRVHDNLYGRSPFMENHPAGSQRLEMSRGTDITELFECSHPNPNVDKILAKYFVKKTDIPRNSPYTPQKQPDGF